VLSQRLARAGWWVVALDAGPFSDPDADWVSDEAGSHHLYWTEPRVIDGTDPVPLGSNNSGRGVGGSMVHFAGYTPRFVRRGRLDGEVPARQRREAHGAAALRGVGGPVLRAAPAGLTSGEAAAGVDLWWSGKYAQHVGNWARSLRRMLQAIGLHGSSCQSPFQAAPRARFRAWKWRAPETG
jgi:hypothetical protein